MTELDGVNDWNKQIIAEFRANEGKVGGPFEGATMLLLHHVGARSGTERVTPLVYFPDGDRMVIVASAAGAPKNPDWYHNIKATRGSRSRSAPTRSPSRRRSWRAPSATRSGPRSRRRHRASRSTRRRPAG